MSSNKKTKKVSRKAHRVEKKRRAARRKNWLWIVGAGIALFAGFFIVTSGAKPKPPITEGLSDEEVAALPSAPVVGSQAPDFTILDVEDNSFTLSNVLGKPTALIFFHSW